MHSKKMLFGINVIMGSAKTSFVLFSALFLDRFGRRPLLLLGSAGMALSLAVLGMGSKFLEHSNMFCVVAVCGVVSFFSIGLGPITWVYSSEIFPLRLRAQGSGLAISVNRLVSGVMSDIFNHFEEDNIRRNVFCAFWNNGSGYGVLLCLYAGDKREDLRRDWGSLRG
ncbi:polyol transporter 5-like protein [Populus alba x Populus x berolinensis]|uniref:Polyol transporter 5-like protein n=1 Tax=Populus alba x Populus x berolinensis TaxID=444605 RepID=A0AAD6QP43_9ROSI|nr:polyol transporter 5-like protein [Populus alba x Populus x berolinensis]